MNERRVHVICLPSGDAAFGHDVRGLMVDDESPDPRRLEERLRRRYPRATVRPRALAGEPDAIWYALRDGRLLGGVTSGSGAGPPATSEYPPHER